MKALIAAACIAIIAAVGFYFWGEFATWRAANQRQANENEARAELFKLANVTPGSPDAIPRMQAWCKAISDVSRNEPNNEAARALTRNCRAFDYL